MRTTRQILQALGDEHEAGYLSVRASVGPTEALLLLRGHAFASGRPLLEVCRDVLAETLTILPPEGDT